MTKELRATSGIRVGTGVAWLICAAAMAVLAFVLPTMSWLFALLAIEACIVGWRWTRMGISLEEDRLVLRNLFRRHVVPREQVVGIRDGQFLNWKSADRQHEVLIGYLMGPVDTGSPNPEGQAKQSATEAVKTWCGSGGSM